MNNRYFLLRHGETIYQTKKRHLMYPWPEKTPVFLTEKGKNQIKIVAKELKNKKIDLIFSSDISRARQTAEIIAKELGSSAKRFNRVNFDKRLRDVNWGIYQGRLKEEFRKFFSSKNERFFKRPPGGENWRDVQKRIMNFFEEIEKKYKNKIILIISHGDPLWLLTGTLKGLNERELLENKFKGLFPNVGQLKELL